MDRLRRTLSFRLKKKENDANKSTLSDDTSKRTRSEKTTKWPDDERAVRVGLCKFHVKYLGSIEVQESRGISLCEQSIQVLTNTKSKPTKAILHVSGDSLRLVDEANMSLILDQTIDKVSFCAPDRHRRKGFAYICRDATARQWRCHAFLAIKDNGERLSHAVGCAFQICTEKKERPIQNSQSPSISSTSFSRFDPLRVTSVLERSTNLQNLVRSKTSEESNANERPRPKGTQINGVVCHNPLRIIDLNQSLLISNQTSKYYKNQEFWFEQRKNYPEPIYEEVETESIEPNQVEKSKSTDTFLSNNNRQLNDENRWSMDSLADDLLTTPRKSSIADAFDTNLTALSQSSRPRNPFSPYAYSIAAQSQCRISILTTPKRNTNPFTDDVRRM